MKPIIIDTPQQLSVNNLFVKLNDIVPAPLYLKCEGFNCAGSIKLKPAIYMIEKLEAQGLLKPGSELIESSSGNLGVALSIVCAAKGYKFTCVTDPVSTENIRYAIRAAGAKLLVIQQQDPGGGGYLQSRINTIKKMCTQNPKLIWINQYANDNNWNAHYHSTAKEIAGSFDRIDWLFIGAGTTGTLMGCHAYFNKYSPHTKIVAVDVEGSVTFGGKKSKRFIPGLGTSRRPEIYNPDVIERQLMVNESDSVKECAHWASKGYFFGGSTGSVLSGLRHYASQILPTETVVAISPDFGDKYMNTVYNPAWVEQHFHAAPQPTINLESA
jgi:2,3-diaminopropionate biosynthesis protein SbnA